MAKRVKKSVKRKVANLVKRVKLSERGERALEDFSKAALSLGVCGNESDEARGRYEHCRSELSKYIGILEAKVVMLRRAK
jgi:hypothetical protein